MENRLALIAEPACAIGHQPLALRRADRGAQVGLARQAAFALPTFRRVQRNDMVARAYTGHASTDFTHNACALMPQHRRKNALAVKAIQRIRISMANARRHNLHQHFTSLWTFQIQLDNFQWLFRFKCNCSAGLHGAWVSIILCQRLFH